ncbi:hypothetical protein BB560_000623 [Smittium megazygosporum]|uniref:SH3 domain-containing protein n=1 Tax=Smittium megazygosporum TaxID=133381 RepID=A0A2T9ZJS3_9FUNG|nr:hypothetical protein BB560_000623 [Smittium megazygosporum]
MRKKKSKATTNSDDNASTTSRSNTFDDEGSQYRFGSVSETRGPAPQNFDSNDSDQFNSALTNRTATAHPGVISMPETGIIMASGLAQVNNQIGSASLGVPESKKTAVALYSYAAQNSRELSFNAGDVVQIVSENDGSGWITGKLQNGNTGEVPANYLDFSNNSSSVKTDTYATALYDFQGRSSEELTFKAGDRIKILNPDDISDWISGSVGNSKGVLPRNYLRINLINNGGN